MIFAMCEGDYAALGFQIGASSCSGDVDGEGEEEK